MSAVLACAPNCKCFPPWLQYQPPGASLRFPGILGQCGTVRTVCSRLPSTPAPNSNANTGKPQVPPSGWCGRFLKNECQDFRPHHEPAPEQLRKASKSSLLAERRVIAREVLHLSRAMRAFLTLIHEFAPEALFCSGSRQAVFKALSRWWRRSASSFAFVGKCLSENPQPSLRYLPAPKARLIDGNMLLLRWTYLISISWLSGKN